jgi:hypothetical protein
MISQLANSIQLNVELLEEKFCFLHISQIFAECEEIFSLFGSFCR